MLKFLRSTLAVIAAIAIALFIKEFLFELHLIPSGSMIPNINVGDRIIVNRFSFGIQNPLYNAKMKKTIMLVLPNPLYKANLPLSRNKYILRFNNKTIHRFDVIVFFPPEVPVLGSEYYFNGDRTSHDPVYFQPPGLLGERYVKRAIGLPGETLELRNGIVYINNHKLKEPQVKNDDYLDFGPVRIPPKHYFFMGDNRTRSSDSRVWGVVPEDHILGRALLVIWPLSSFKLIR